MIGTLTLNPCLDRFLYVKKLGGRDAVRAYKVERVAAGKGINVSRFVRALGETTMAYTLIGGATGAEWARLAGIDGIPAIALQVEGETRVNWTLREDETKKEIRVLEPGPQVHPENARSLEVLALSRSKVFSAFVLSGSLPPGLNPKIYAEWIVSLNKRGVRCFLDADGAALREGIRARPFAVKPNQYEIEDLVGKRLRTRKSLESAARSIVDKGIELVVVSLERRGALFAGSRFAPFWLAAPQVRVQGRVGAGDALLAGLVTALVKRKNIREAALISIAVASAVVSGNTKNLSGLLK